MAVCNHNVGEQSNLLRQLAEIEASRAIFSEGEFQTTQEQEAVLESLALDGENFHGEQIKELSFTLCPSTLTLGGCPVKMHVSLPAGYPGGQQVLHVALECGGSTSRQQYDTVNRVARETAEKHLGEESILSVLYAIQETVEDIEKTGSDGVSVDGLQQESGECSHELVLKRKLIWFHHIKSPAKRKNIVEWGKELHLGGLCKPGFPGILICEGEERNVMTYLRQLQSLRWQALQVRGEEAEKAKRVEDFDTMRRFSLGIKELHESGMSEMGALCREAGLETLFLSGLKISR